MSSNDEACALCGVNHHDPKAPSCRAWWLSERRRKSEAAGLPPMDRAEHDENGRVILRSPVSPKRTSAPGE